MTIPGTSETLSAQLTASIKASAGAGAPSTCELSTSFKSSAPAKDSTVSLWQWALQGGAALLSQESTLLDNNGFGVLHHCAVSSARKTAAAAAAAAATVAAAAGASASACAWGPELQNQYISLCPDGSAGGCPAFPTLLAAKAACDSDVSCLGITLSTTAAPASAATANASATSSGGAGGGSYQLSYQLRGSPKTQGSPSGESSWLILDPVSCGHRPDPAALGCSSFGGQYPQKTFQFVALYGAPPTTAAATAATGANGAGAATDGPNGLYFGTHDPTAASKNFHVTVGDGRASFQVRGAVSAVGVR
jgi:hypothetical protein